VTDFGALKSDDLAGLVDPDALARWLDAQGIEPAAPLEIRRLSAGMSNESFELRRGAGHYVLRRPSKIAIAGSDLTMAREFRLLTALEGTPVPHARPLALCTELEVLGFAFYVMEFVAGFTSLDAVPERFDRDKKLQHEAALSCMQALGELARVDWRARGLTDFGRPDGFHQRQVTRWMRQLDSYEARELPGIQAVGKWLGKNQPIDWSPAIMHGDYHAANVLVAPDAPGRVAAILDWENATIGDPALDLGGFLRLWRRSDRSDWAAPEEMIATWEASSGRTAPDLRYYMALSAFRHAVLVEGVYQRALADPTREASETLADLVTGAIQDAEQAIAE
jgi:aminoglycoside phosphotransferase (APT) family kinase protein